MTCLADVARLPVDPPLGSDDPADGVQAEKVLLRVESVGEAGLDGDAAYHRVDRYFLCNM